MGLKIRTDDIRIENENTILDIESLKEEQGIQVSLYGFTLPSKYVSKADRKEVLYLLEKDRVTSLIRLSIGKDYNGEWEDYRNYLIDYWKDAEVLFYKDWEPKEDKFDPWEGK